MVLDSGKELETIFVTHDHLDHFFAMEVLTNAFPNAKVVAHPTVVEDIWRSLPFKVKRWSPMLGDNGPKTPTAPKTRTRLSRNAPPARSRSSLRCGNRTA